ncbi:MAG: restriction endonuclease subunit S, partial [Candidatus Shapirobacteria bacterium]
KETGWLCGTGSLRIRVNHKVVLSTFVAYLLSTDDIKGWISGNAVGTTMPNLNSSILIRVPLELPPLPEQRAIASILSSLDDKIDLLHRQNKTMEAMAELLFKQWFIHEPDEKWEEKPLSAIASFLNGIACQNYPPTNEADRLPVLKIKELSTGITESSDWATSNIDQSYIVKNGDVIFSWSASLIVKVWDGDECVLNQHLFKVTSMEYPKWFYLSWCRYHLNEFIAISATHATTMGHIKRGDLDNAKVLIPSQIELAMMSQILNPLLDRRIVISKQIRTLKECRDTLLPKLMSGDVRVEA